jgi:tRNA A-37 threonylcarbamoyl transferase component Bud32
VAVTPPPTGSSSAAGVDAGTILGGRYRLDGQLASGGMAQVWRGTDEVLRRAIAVKILHPHLAADDTFVTRFRHEAIAVARLSHPAIVNVYDTCSANGTEAIVMELVRGHTLRDRLDEGPLDPWVAANIAAQVAGALDVAHAAGLVHRDIKPANILLSEDGRVKVGDFGIAKAAESADLTQEGSFVGTAKYLAPEQVESKPVDGRTDLYSLGIVLYEMLCGRVPFEGDSSSATALARLHQDPMRPRQVRPGIPRALEAITMRLLARNPDDRYPTSADVRAELLGAGADDRATGTDVDATVAGPLASPMAPPGSVAQPATGVRPAAGPLGGPIGGPVGPPTTGTRAEVRFADSERRWLVPTLLVILVAVALGVAGLLLQRSGTLLGDDNDPSESTTTTAAPSGQEVGIARAIDFDPEGDDGRERPEVVDLAIDGDPNTAWETTSYRRPDLEWGGLKSGVGIMVELDEAADISAVEVDSQFSGWTAEIYVSDRAQTSGLDAWGEPVGRIEGAQSGTNRVELDQPTEGGAVLVWLTSQGDGRPQMTISEIRVQS